MAPTRKTRWYYFQMPKGTLLRRITKTGFDWWYFRPGEWIRSDTWTLECVRRNGWLITKREAERRFPGSTK